MAQPLATLKPHDCKTSNDCVAGEFCTYHGPRPPIELRLRLDAKTFALCRAAYALMGLEGPRPFKPSFRRMFKRGPYPGCSPEFAEKWREGVRESWAECLEIAALS